MVNVEASEVETEGRRIPAQKGSSEKGVLNPVQE
jgi:hypothetical protein